MKHNRKLNRLKDYDYSRTGAYFITLCTQNIENHFGIVDSGRVILNDKGLIIKKYLNEIPHHYNEIKLDENIIMPNHVHAIIMIFENEFEKANENAATINNRNYGLISKIVKSFKDVTIKEIRNRLNDIQFKWQRSYYDRIIRDETELNNIREYIHVNPLKFDFKKEHMFAENLERKNGSSEYFNN